MDYENEIDGISPIQPKRLKFRETEEREVTSSKSISACSAEGENTHIDTEVNQNLGKEGSKKNLNASASENSSVANSSFFTVSKAPNISCKLHGSIHINVDNMTFKLFCKMCKDLGKKSNLQFDDETQDDVKTQDDEIFCNNHHTQKGVFFCEDCKQFLCKNCFANSHRNHKSNLPSYAASSFKKFIKQIISEVEKIKPKMDESLDQITKTNLKLKSMRDVPSKTIKETTDKIGQVCKAKLENLEKDFSNIFKNLDVEVEGVANRVVGLNKKSVKFIHELADFVKLISCKSDPLEICVLKKNKDKLMKDIKLVIEESKNLIGFKTAKIKKEVEEKAEVINKEVTSFHKNVKIFENSMLTSIVSGMKNFSVSLRRFTKYNRRGLSYYKSSSIEMKVCSPVFLSGLALCGLYIPSSKLSNQKSPIYTDIKERGHIPVEIQISEFREDNFEVKLFESHQLFGVLNSNDPTFLIYLKKAVFLKPDTRYVISINNCDINSYVDLWTGEVNKSALSSMEQTIRCNVTKTEFVFSPAKGLESDLNEFNAGIIASLIFAKNE